MARRVAVVTGSNKGIGLSTVKFLCQQLDGDVFLCSRDLKRGEDAVSLLKQEGVSPKLAQLDINDPNSVDALRDRLVKEYGGLDILVNNAAIAYKHDSQAPFGEQAEETIRCNYFSTMSVCDILFPILKPHARVVNVSSSLGLLRVVKGETLRERLSSSTLTRQEVDSLAHEFVKDAQTAAHVESGWPNSAYGTSKVLLSAVTFAQHRSFQQDPREDLVVNVVHPGYVNTDMTSHRGFLTPDQGCQSSVKAALVPAGGEPRGQFIWEDCTVVDWVHHDKR